MVNRFREFMLSVTRSMNKHHVKYKYFGGCTVSMFNPSRVTSDLDIAISVSVANTEKFIDALADCGFADRDFISMQVYGEGGRPGDGMHSTCYIQSTKPDWESFHIDLMFNLGEHTFDNLKSEVFVLEGVPIEMVKPREIIRMKANIIPRPRDKDIEDIEFLANMLGLDPATGQPIVEEPKGDTLIGKIEKMKWW